MSDLALFSTVFAFTFLWLSGLRLSPLFSTVVIIIIIKSTFGV